MDPRAPVPPPGLATLRRALHRSPEPGGRERATAARMAGALSACRPDRLLAGLGGHGLAAVWDAPSAAAGPAVLLRAELDALPDGEGRAAHRCGHDGHLALLAGVARALATRPPSRGRVILLLQPDEEGGRGARAVRDDPRWPSLAPDLVFALHNLPGHDRGRVLLRTGPLTAASEVVALAGPGPQALARLVPWLVAQPVALEAHGTRTLVTVDHADDGRRLLATLRAEDAGTLAELRGRVARVAREGGATADTVQHLPATANHPDAVDLARRAAARAGLVTGPLSASPFAWSEDFGWLLQDAPGALVGLGAGTDHPALHAPDYAFPDALLAPGVAFWTALLAEAGVRDADA